MKKFNVKSVVASAVLAALVFVLIRFVAIPTPLPNTTLSIYAAVSAFFAVLFGPVVGFLGTFIGDLLVDVTAGWGIWWSWIIPTGLYGLLMGLCCRKIFLDDGEFGKKEIIKFIISSFICCAICWGLLCPLFDILFYSEPAGKVFAQGACVGLSGFVSTAVIGTILCKAYAATRAKKGSLKKED